MSGWWSRRTPTGNRPHADVAEQPVIPSEARNDIGSCRIRHVFFPRKTLVRSRFLLAALAALAAFVARETASAQIATTEYAQRRAALAAKLQDGVLLGIGSREPAQDYLSFF